ncbi:disease resistance protein RPV1-like [Rosa rugosa]|uniref:disease resistance protein RPV1-like n=1 Tax=Rosa rugosa TaxID=74645 RepID=UPI002B417B7B|nr:disease resistance protein RPV1-like [Rosa rugosa]
MATQLVAPSSSSSALIKSWKYDVFLSFRGEDTRYGFTSHLYHSLVQNGISTFKDDGLQIGEAVSPALVKQIEESKASIIIFSENYASSAWCLEELVTILRCKESKKQMILPVFYKVDSSDVRYQTGNFGEALTKLEHKFHKKIHQWREALAQAANLPGWTFSDGYESEFIHQIVEHISFDVLDRIYLDVAKYPVGIESRVQDVAELVGVGGDDVRMVGIWGTGGIGKTTIAKAVYNSIVHKFESSCFLENVRESSMPYRGLVQLQKMLLSQILRGQELKLTSVDHGIIVIKQRLRNKRVLLVLDDVNQLNQLDKLAGGSDWFGSGSRIIITTRDHHLLIAHQVNFIYRVKKLNYHEASELFSWNVFRGQRPSNDFVKLANYVVRYAEGLPLALLVLGSILCGRTVEEWQEAKDSNWKFCNRSLHQTLKISYDALDDPEKEVFLDIACFFNGENKNHVIQILEGGDLNPKNSISVLQEKAFININEENLILMDNLLEQMGKEIVHNESPNEPSKRSRLWFHEDVYEVLTEGTGTNKIKGIMVKLPDPDEIVLSATSFLGMKNLKYFINCNASFSGLFDYLPDKLQLIDWPGFPFQCLPLNFIPKKLVKLNMPRSSMSRLGERFKLSKSLRYINLEGCQLLREIPDLSGFPNLKVLNLNNCTSLDEVGDSIGLEKLVALSLSGCINLTGLPTLISLKSLEYVNLKGCKMFKSFPEIVPGMEFLTSLDISGTAIKELPSSIANLISLEELTIRGCKSLTNLPCSIFKLCHLWSLDLQDCSKLVTFPKWSAESGSAEPDLSNLNLRGCNKLQEIPELPPKVDWVNATDCISLERFAKLSNILEHKESQMFKCLTLFNCKKLCVSLSHGMAEIEHILLDKICSLFLSCTQSEFEVVFPGSAVPKWFNHHEDLKARGDTSEFSFEIPRNFKVGTKGLAICAAAASVEEINSKEQESAYNNCSFAVRIDIDEESIVTRSFSFEAKDMHSAHMWLLYIPFIKFAYRRSLPFCCRVRLEQTSQGSVSCKSYGVHLVNTKAESEDEDDEKLEDDYLLDDESDEDMKE